MTEDQFEAGRHFGVDPSRVHIDRTVPQVKVRLHDITQEEFTELAPLCNDKYHLSRLKPGEALRLGCRTNDTWDALFALYQKGSLDAETIVELVGDPSGLSLDEEQFNEVVNKAVANAMESLKASDGAKKMAEQLGLDFAAPKQTGPRGIEVGDTIPSIKVQCPACDGVGWTALFMVRQDCEYCEGNCEVWADKWFDYQDEEGTKK